MYKQHIRLKIKQIIRQNRALQRRPGLTLQRVEFTETAYSALFATLSLLQMGICSRTLDLHGTKVQYNAGRYGSEAVLLAAHKRGMPWSAAVIKGVAVSSCVSKMQWLLAQHKWKLPADVAAFAAEAGSVGMLKLLKQHGAAFTAETSTRAVKPGRLYVLRYLHSQGCRTNSDTADAAAHCGALGVVKFLHSIQPDFNHEQALRSASCTGHIEIVIWLVEQGWQPSGFVLHGAAIYGHIDVCKYLMEHGCEWTAQITESTITCSPDLIPWALSQGVKLTTEQQIRLGKCIEKREKERGFLGRDY
jgi:Ankyrin repeats (3 copies)